MLENQGTSCEVDLIGYNPLKAATESQQLGYVFGQLAR